MRAIQFGAKHFVVNSTSLQLLNDFVLGFETERSEVRQSFLAKYLLCPLSHYFTQLVPLYHCIRQILVMPHRQNSLRQFVSVVTEYIQNVDTKDANNVVNIRFR